MSYNGSGTFVINSAGMPLVPFQRDLSSTFNALTADLATGLSTAITKDGQTTTTALITFAAGISATLVTDATSISTGSLLTSGGLGVTKAAWIGGLMNVAGAATLQSTLAVTGTSTMAAINASGLVTASAGLTVSAGATTFGAEGKIAQNGSGLDLVPTTGRSFRVLNAGMSASQFSVAEATGNTLVGGTLGVTGTSTFTGSLFPNTDLSADMGSAAKRFDTLYIRHLVVGTAADPGINNAAISGTLSVTSTSTMAAINASGNINVSSSNIVLTAATGAIDMKGALTLAPASANPQIFLTDVTKGSAYLQGGVNTGGTGAGDYWIFNVPTSRGLSWAVNNSTVLNAVAGGVVSPVSIRSTATSNTVGTPTFYLSASMIREGADASFNVDTFDGAAYQNRLKIVGATGASTFTKGAAGDVLVLTNGGATPKPLYFYSDASTSSIGTSASQANSLLAFVGTTSMQLNIAGGAVQSWTTAGTNVTGSLTVTNTVQPTIYLKKTNATAAEWLIYNNGNLGFTDGTNYPLYFVGANSIFGGTLAVGTGNTTEATAQLVVQAAGYGGYHWADGTAYYIGQNSAARSLRIYSSSYTAGVNLAAGGTSWGTFSDERLKYDIEPITDGLNKLNGIRCVSYRLIDVDAPDSQKKLGVIAQDLVGVVDEVIDATKRNGDETDYMSVRYTELIPVLIKAIQELAADFQAYKSSHP